MNRLLAFLLLTASFAAAQSLNRERTLTLPPNVTVASTAIARAGNYLAARCSDQQIRVWKLGSGDAAPQAFTLDNDPIAQIAISSDGTLLAAGARSGAVRVWEVASGKVRLNVVAANSPTRRRSAEVVAISPDNRLVAIGPMDSPVEVWDLAEQKKIATLRPQFGGVNALAFSPDNKWIATADGSTEVRVYDARTAGLRSTTADLLLEPFAVQFTPDGKWILAGGADKEVSLIDPATGKIARKLEKAADPVIALVIAPDGNRAVVAYVNEKSFALPAPFAVWDLSKSSVITKLPQPDDVANGGEFLADGRLLMTSTVKNELRVWSLR
jgi:WD40 repeat protein